MKMYLSRIRYNKGDDYNIHQKLKKIFDGADVLFQRGQFETIVMSDRAPFVREMPMTVKMITGDVSAIDKGSEVSFTIRLNPVKTKKGKRHPIEQNRLKEWIENKMASAGMDTEFIYNYEGLRISRKKDFIITLSSVFVIGVGEVTDVFAFKESLSSGIGHSKGLGFGMINIFANELFLPENYHAAYFS
jgi:CRISPR-associated protein Cas6/Cse3/CasE subtype I-E